MRTISAKGRALALLIAIVTLVALVPTGASAGPKGQSCENANNNTPAKLLECVTLEGVRQHQAAFQAIADAHGGTRASGTPGYDASVDHVAGLLEAAGYDVTRQEFLFPFFQELSPAVLEQVSPDPGAYGTGAYEFSGPGDVTGPVTPVDINLDQPGGASTSGCEATDFDGVDLSAPNDIALLQRGTCNFSVKALNAQNAGAEAVIIFNQGNSPGREGLIVGTLGGESADVIEVPVVGASYADGVDLADPFPGTIARVVTDTFSEVRPTENVIAELDGRNDDNVVMLGGHLDSVVEGPGIQDNGSGTAALLEVALKMRKLSPENTLRFAFWGAEESGLLGSEHYVADLSDAELDDIALYLNFDMIASPNYIFMAYDADESQFAAPAGIPIPDGSIAIEDLFEGFYTQQGEPYDDAQFSGRSDYQAFILEGIPSGGLFTGAEVVKSPEQQAIWGGTAGEQFDPCYHLACDTFANNSLHALDVNADAIAYAALTYAYSTESVNGVKGAQAPGNPGALPSPAGPEGTTGSGGGDGPHHEHIGS